VKRTKINKTYICLFAENVMFLNLKDIKLILETIKKLDKLRIATKMKFRYGINNASAYLKKSKLIEITNKAFAGVGKPIKSVLFDGSFKLNFANLNAEFIGMSKRNSR
jgi:hypothetical protein